MTKTILVSEATEQRAAAERAIARYPALEAHEIEAVKRYLRKEATALDRASIASDPALQGQYRQFCRDHHFDSLRPFEMVLVALGLTAVVALVLAIYMLR